MATRDSDTAQIIMAEDKQSNSLNMIAIAVIVACVVAVAALIVAVVGISKQSSIVVNQPAASSGGSGSRGSSITIQSSSAGGASAGDNKIWRFHIGHFGGNTQYIDEASGQVRGYDVDVINRVCQIAGKSCIIAWDIYENCWDSQSGQRARGGAGLMGNWYDACIGWLQTRDRRRTYEFSKQFGKAYPVGLFVKANGNVPSYPDLAGVKIGFLDGWYSDEHCLVRYDQLSGFDQTDASTVIHYQTENEIAVALQNNEIGVAFTGRTPGMLVDDRVDLFMVGDFGVNECVVDGVSLMLPKANVELTAWFNPAFDRLVGSRDYDDICSDLTVAHGGRAGYDPADYCIQ